MIVADTGVLYALVDASDDWHERVVAWWRTASEPIVVPVTVVPEITYLLHQRISPEAERAFVVAVAKGEFALEALEADDIERAADVMEKYADLGVGFVDASVVAIAERLEVRAIATTDRRHFGTIRPRHSRSFTLLP